MDRDLIKGICKMVGFVGIVVATGLYIMAAMITFDPLTIKITELAFIIGIPSIALFVAGFLIRETISKFICGYCDYIAETERELHNHSLNCEKYQESKSIQSRKSDW